MKKIIVIAITFAATLGFSQNSLILKTTSSFNHPVIHQTQPQFLKATAKADLYRKFYITRWGTQRYEYGYIDIQCTVKKCSFLNQEIRIAFFEQCTGFSKNLKPKCSGLVSNEQTELAPAESTEPWYQCDDYNGCSYNSQDTDFPQRSEPSDTTLF